MHAGIVGAGIIGRLLALELINAGWHVSLFDQTAIETTTSCSMAAAGLLTPVTELDTVEPLIHHMGVASLRDHWPALIAQLPASLYFRQQGSLVTAFAHDRGEMTRLAQNIAYKLPQQTAYYSLTSAQIAELEPALAHLETAYYFPHEGQIDNQALMQMLAEHLLAKKIAWFPNTQIQLLDAHQITVNNSIQQFDVVCDCRGLGGKTFFPDVRGVRGEVVWLHAPEVFIERPIRVVHPRYKIYIAPRPQQCYVIGATEIESEDTSPISVRSLLELLSAAYNLHPGFREARVINTLTQCRPTLPDHLPRIHHQAGLIAINGLYRHGFLLAPLLCHEVALALSSGINNLKYPQLWQELQ